MTHREDSDLFRRFFTGRAREFLLRGIDLALQEDGEDLTSRGLFAAEDEMEADLVAKEDTIVAGLPLLEIITYRFSGKMDVAVLEMVAEGGPAQKGECICRLRGSARTILKTERVMVNYIAHLSGIADLTHHFLSRIHGSGTRLLDTRKTLPGLRYPEKYAVRVGGGCNHRLDLAQMLMLKDNHIDRAGGIAPAVARLRDAYSPCPPLVVECRTLGEVEEAVFCGVDRVLLDNMDPETISLALQMIPASVESEISGGVNLDSLQELARLGADYISSGALTDSAPFKDLSLRCELIGRRKQ